MKKPKTKRPYTRRAAPPPPTPFVVYVRYPSSPKEYAYLCTFPVRQGDTVRANGGACVTVIRTAASDPIAWKYVSPDTQTSAELRANIVRRLIEIERAQLEYKRFASLARRNPEARKLLDELKKL